MHNTFVTRGFDWAQGASRPIALANRVLARLGTGLRLRFPQSTGAMTSLEQRINLYHFVSQVLAYGVPGDLVELGSFAGESALLIATVAQREGDGRTLHLYDSFEPLWGQDDPQATLRGHFAKAGLSPPVIHAGRFEQTLPAALPERIAFVNVDTGCGRDPRAHADQIAWLLSLVYPRLSPGAIVSLIDYHDPSEHRAFICPNPGVKPGADRFLADRPEKVSVLYGGDYGHGYFRRAG